MTMDFVYECIDAEYSHQWSTFNFDDKQFFDELSDFFSDFKINKGDIFVYINFNNENDSTMFKLIFSDYKPKTRIFHIPSMKTKFTPEELIENEKMWIEENK